MAVQIQLRRGLDADWTSEDPLLAEGELALSTDLNKLKVGNGVDNWSALDYINVAEVNWGDIGGTLSDQTDLQSALDAKQDSLGFTAENVANKSTTLSADQASNTKYPSVKSVYDWATGLFQTALGFTAENVANKSTNVVTDQASNTKYPSVKSVYDWVVANFQASLGFTAVPNTRQVNGHALNADVTVTKGDVSLGNVTNDAQLKDADKDTDGTLAANSDAKIPSQKAVKTYADAKVSDTAYASSWDAVTDKSPSKNAVYDQFESSSAEDLELAYRALGSSIKALPVGGNPHIMSGLSNLADASVFFVACYVKKSFTATGVKWIQGTQGAYTADQNNKIGLYSYSGGTLTLIASCANDGNLWKATANSCALKAFATPVALTPGIYFIAGLANWSAVTTTPTARGYSGSNNIQMALDFTNSSKIMCTLAAQTDLPTPQVMSGLTTQISTIWLALY